MSSTDKTQLSEKMHTGNYVQAGSSLSEFFNRLEQFTPVIPDSVTQHFMEKSGISSTDPRIIRLIALASQKFLSDIALDAMQQAKVKGQGTTKKGAQEIRYSMTTELLDPILREYGSQE